MLQGMTKQEQGCNILELRQRRILEYNNHVGLYTVVGKQQSHVGNLNKYFEISLS